MNGLDLRLLSLMHVELAFVAITAVYLIECNEAEITEEVIRRSSGDIFKLKSDLESGLSVCSDNGELNYFVSEGRCVTNLELLNGCRFQIAPAGEIQTSALLLKITNGTGVAVQMYDEVLMRAVTSDSSDAVIVHNGTNQLAVSSLCHIAYLEVYRGSRQNQAFVISHEGLSFNEQGNIKINSSKLAYGFEDYLGELFRMNLSCSGGGFPDNGCLFFKVLGRTNVTNAKFNDIVPGTIYGDGNPAISTPDIQNVTSESVSVTSRITPSTPPTSRDDSHTNNEFLTYILIAGSLVAALLFIVLLLCIILVYCCLTTKKKTELRSNVITSENLWCGQRDLIAIQNDRQHEYPHEKNTETFQAE